MKNIKNWLAAACFCLPVVTWAEPVDINQATAEEIATALKGIGLAKAQAIVAHRENFGPFTSVEDLTLVKGIGAKTVEENRSDIIVKSGQQ